VVNSSSRSLQALAGKGPEDIAIFGASSRQAHDPWTALCIHGTLDRAASFSRLTRRLEDFDVIAYDRRGYQGSRGAGASSRFGRHVDDALDIVAATHHDQPVVLIGHSFGGLIALATAIAAPGAIDAVVVYEPPLRWFDESSGEFEHPLIFDEPEREVEKFFRRMVSNASWDRMNQSARRERLDDAGGLFSDIEMTRDEIPFRIDDLNRIAIPVTFGVGDVVMNPDYGRVAKVVVDALPQGRFVVAKGAAHGIHLTHPASFADMVIETTKRSTRESTH
jgi:pimeloyl-ACP methyl ester carboxylesterase